MNFVVPKEWIKLLLSLLYIILYYQVISIKADCALVACHTSVDVVLNSANRLLFTRDLRCWATEDNISIDNVNTSAKLLLRIHQVDIIRYFSYSNGGKCYGFLSKDFTRPNVTSWRYDITLIKLQQVIVIQVCNIIVIRVELSKSGVE